MQYQLRSKTIRVPCVRAVRTRRVARRGVRPSAEYDMFDLLSLCVPTPAPELDLEDMRVLDTYFEELSQQALLPP